MGHSGTHGEAADINAAFVDGMHLLHMLDQCQHKIYIAGQNRQIKNIPTLAARRGREYHDQVFPVGNIVPVALLGAIQRYAVYPVEIKHQRHFFLAAAQLRRDILIPCVRIVVVHAETCILYMGGKAALRKSGTVLVMTIHIILPAAGAAEQIFPRQPHGFRIRGTLCSDQTALGIFAVVRNNTVMLRLPACLAVRMHQIRSHQRIAAPCGGFHIQRTVRQRIAVRQVGNHHDRHIQRAQGCQRCQHGGGFRGIRNVEDHPVKAVHPQLAAAQHTEAAHQIIHIVFARGVVGVIPALLRGVGEQKQKMFFLSQCIQP